MEQAEPVRRTSEIEEPTNLYVIHPLAARLTVLLAAWHVPPNAVSLAGMLFGILAGCAYYRYQDWRWAVAGFGLMLAWHVMDGADGQLARLTNRQSETGKVLDGICDYVTFIAVYIGLAVVLSRQDGAFVLLLVGLAGVCHAVQSAAYEVHRQAYNFWGWGRTAAAPPALRPATYGQDSELPRAFALLLGVYERLQVLVTGHETGFDNALGAALAARPAEAAAIRTRYRACFAPAIRSWSILSSNYRTLGIFICALVKLPLLYFCFEIAGFSLILLVLARRRRARAAAFIAALSTL